MNYKSNIREIVVKYNARLGALKDLDPLKRKIASSLQAANRARIHGSGLAENESPIASGYSTTPMYVSPAIFRRSKFKGKPIVPQGKNSTDKNFKNGKPRKSRFLPGGYKQFRQEQTGTTSPMNLFLTGTLRSDFIISQNGKEWLVGFATDYGSEVSKGLEAKYGKRIWGISPKEETQTREAIVNYINRKLKGNA